MAFWNRKKKNVRPPNPHSQVRGFYSPDSDRLLTGWTSQSSSIDYYLGEDLTSLRARSRELVRKNPYGAQFVRVMRKNIVGHSGVSVQARTTIFRNGQEVLDERANTAIETAWKDWCQSHCDYRGQSAFIDLQRMAVNSACQDGEFLFRLHYGASLGKYGFQIEEIDPELLDVDKHQKNRSGEIRLGVEYDQRGRVIRYWFREKDEAGNYYSGRRYSVDAKYIIHGFIRQFPDQSRGIPWAHASLESAKHLEKYEESAIIAARAGANQGGFFKNSSPEDAYKGEEEGAGAYDGDTIAGSDPMQFTNIGNNEFIQYDPKYPHEMYEQFVGQRIRRLAAGSGTSYESMSGDLKGATYSSMRMGALDEREYYKELQDWFVQAFIKPIYFEWLSTAYLKSAITIGRFPLSRPIDDYMFAHFQPRRWQWVDPIKEANAHKQAIELGLKSRSQIMREQGDDPDSVWREIQRENEIMRQMGILDEPDEPEQDA